jgi:PAS domain S-box-containing protein
MEKTRRSLKLKKTGLKEYDVIEEKLTLLNMAMKSAGIGTWVFDLVGNKRYFDNKACQLLGFVPLQYKRTAKEFLDRIHPEDRGTVKKQLSNLIKEKSDLETEFRVIWPDGTLRFLTAKAKIIINDTGVPVRLNGLIWDITEQKLLQINLQENIRKTDSIINNLNGAVFRCKFDKEMTMEYISEGIKELSGYPLSDFLMNHVRSFASLISVDDKKRVMKSIGDALNEKNSFKVEYRILSAQGDIKWIWERGKGVFKGRKIVALEGFISDITDRKKMEEELESSLEQLHKLAQHIEEVRETERVAISRELHDDLGQALTAVKIDLATIKQNVTDMATVLKINKASALISDTIKTVQRLTSQLRPQIIDDLGLNTAIEWYAKEFEQRNRIKIFLDMDSDITIPPDASLIIFRIMQEALTNIARHSGATTVKIMLTRKGDNINFSISDNGIGITEDKINSKKSFGIISMKERSASLGGTFKISREDDHFTVINLIFPISNKVTNENSDL